MPGGSGNRDSIGSSSPGFVRYVTAESCIGCYAGPVVSTSSMDRFVSLDLTLEISSFS